MKIYAVYTQFYPTWKYEPELVSIWDNIEGAQKAASKERGTDFVWIEELKLNQETVHAVDEQEEVFFEWVKKP